MDARSVPAPAAAEGAHTADHVTGISVPRNHRSESNTDPTLGRCQGELFGEESKLLSVPSLRDRTIFQERFRLLTQ
jgi:hypothetical protein